MQSVNGVQCLNITQLFLLSDHFATSSATAGPPVIVIVLLTRIYASLTCKLDFNIVALNSVLLLVLYVPRVSSFISIQFFILNLDG